MKAVFTVDGSSLKRPKPCFSPQENIYYEDLVQLEYTKQCNKQKFDGHKPIRVSVIIFCSKNDKISRKSADIIARSVCSSLYGFAFSSDVRFFEVYAIKVYADTHRIKITISEVC